MSIQTRYRYSHTVGIFAPMGGRGFASPVDLVLDREGIMYVVNRAGADNKPGTYHKRICRCTVDEKFLGEFSNEGTGEGDLMWPVAIAMDKDEKIYVSDEDLQRISMFNKEGQYLGKWGMEGTAPGEFDRPAGIAFDGDDNLLVVDGLNNRVQKFTKDGRFLSGWGRSGTGPGEFDMPWGISVDRAGKVFVVDWRNDRVQKFDAGGNHLATFGTPGQGEGQFHRPSGVTTDRDGNIYVADWGNQRVQVLAPDGRFIDQFRGESKLSSWAHEYYTSNKDEFQARQESNMEPPLELPADDFLYNQSAAIEKLLWGPTSVKVDDQGRVYVVDSLRQRIQIYSREV